MPALSADSFRLSVSAVSSFAMAANIAGCFLRDRRNVRKQISGAGDRRMLPRQDFVHQ
jgi:hypothetical protein